MGGAKIVTKRHLKDPKQQPIVGSRTGKSVENLTTVPKKAY